MQEGRVIAEAGEPALVTYLRSSAKPIQALPLARARPDLADDELAIACSSHLARPEQLDAVRRLLADAPACEDELECGPEPTPLQHTCSGKHAGFLALCRSHGWPRAGYRLADHPLQRLMLAEIATAAEAEPESIPTGVDGCGVATFALPLERIANAFGRFRQLEGGARIAEAICAQPDLIRGPASADSMAMRALPGWIAKGGVEGLFCASSADGVGIAVKVEDGETRAVRPALAEILRRLGHDLGVEFGVVRIANSLGEPVAEIAIA